MGFKTTMPIYINEGSGPLYFMHNLRVTRVLHEISEDYNHKNYSALEGEGR